MRLALPPAVLLFASSALAADDDAELAMTLAGLAAFIVVTILGTMTAFTLALIAPFLAVLSLERRLGKSPLLLSLVLLAVAGMNAFFLLDDDDLDNHRFLAWNGLVLGTALLLAAAPFAPRLPPALSFGATVVVLGGGLAFSLSSASARLGDALAGQGAVEAGGLYVLVAAAGFALVRRRSLGAEGVGLCALLGALPLLGAWLARPLAF